MVTFTHESVHVVEVGESSFWQHLTGPEWQQGMWCKEHMPDQLPSDHVSTYESTKTATY